MKITFLGIGLMGRPMAINLLKAGYSLTLWNRTQSKAEALIDLGAIVKSSPRDAVANADITIIMLENGPIVDQVLFAPQADLTFKPGSTVIDMSSIPPELAKQHYRKFQALGINYLDAPVSGGTVGAE
ncbi:MAG: NAD(P)-binding domain-containing protein, partial [Amphritea sp.]|nr:NAD(P)-binding domain-containing protein [Amphritea sp.]MBQ0784256.1 NAD(P)-binding domain-containing protein [Amphritea sp.]